MAKIQEFHLNYASLKARGVGAKKEYIFTHHKNPVKVSGFESASSVQNSIAVYASKINGGADSAARFENSIIRSKNNVIQLVANNPWDYFVTLTISSESSTDRYNLKQAKKQITQFLVNYSRRSGLSSGFKYLLIPEFHKDGAIHFHGVFKGVNPHDLAINKYGYWDFVPYCERFGFCSLGVINDLSSCAYYMSKYMTKDMFLNQPIENGTHLYFASKGLKKDEIVRVGSSNYSIDDFIQAGYEPYENQFCAKIKTDNLDDCKNWIMPFGKQFKTGVNVSINPLSEKKKIELKKIQILRYKSLEEIKGNFDINNLWNMIMKEFCCGVTQYEIYKRKFEELKKCCNFISEKKELNEYELQKIEDIFNQSFNGINGSPPFTDVRKYEQIGIG